MTAFDPAFEAVAHVIGEHGWVGTPTAAVLVYEWMDADGHGVIGITSSEGIRDATMLGLLTWAKAHVIDSMLDQPELEE